ncbi:MAG: hypothetical protein P8J25_01095 [Porticoccaceae bacterium]|nr:hypothetical protein [Porticoccaceae bacterium]
MKTHTQQQTKLKLETTATEPKLSSRKRSEYRPRKSRGNTLVPVIIALAISAIATVAFLNQGADLSTKNKIVIAQNEFASAMGDWVVIRANSGVGTDSHSPKPENRGNIFGGGGTKFVRLIEKIEQGGAVVPEMAKNAPYMVYETDDETSCKFLKDRLSVSIDGLESAHCINNETPVKDSAKGKYLLIVLN